MAGKPSVEKLIWSHDKSRPKQVRFAEDLESAEKSENVPSRMAGAEEPEPDPGEVVAQEAQGANLPGPGSQEVAVTSELHEVATGLSQEPELHVVYESCPDSSKSVKDVYHMRVEHGAEKRENVETHSGVETEEVLPADHLC